MAKQDLTTTDFTDATVLDMPRLGLFDYDPKELRERLKRQAQNRKALLRWCRRSLKVGKHFARLHMYGKNRCQFAKENRADECPNDKHWSDPVLLQPGAQEVIARFNLRASWPGLEAYERLAQEGKRIELIVLRCHIVTAEGHIVSEGIGARRPGLDNDDMNKCLKMCCKSGFVHATLNPPFGLSELFTQDLEDMQQRKLAGQNGNGNNDPDITFITADQASALHDKLRLYFEEKFDADEAVKMTNATLGKLATKLKCEGHRIEKLNAVAYSDAVLMLERWIVRQREIDQGNERT